MKFTMTEEDFNTLLKASQPVPLIALHCGNPSSAYSTCNGSLACTWRKMGFYANTVMPSNSGSKFDFEALPKLTDKNDN